MRKACTVCGVISDQSKCPAHRRQKPPSNQRGYDAAYKRARRRLKARVDANGGFICGDGMGRDWCGRWFPPEAMTADHDPPLAQSSVRHHNLVPACQSCNYGRTANTRRL